MFYEFRQLGREEWKYPFLGEELLPHARRLCRQYRDAEMAARESLAGLMRDPTVRSDDDRIDTLKSVIETTGKQYEACTVFTVGFTREPERVFQLSLGDVVYFGLTPVTSSGGE